MQPFYKVYKSIYERLTQQQKHVLCPIEAWVDILDNVLHSQGEVTARVGRYTATWNHNEWPASQRYLAFRWGWSTSRVRHFLQMLCDDGLITLRRSGQTTIIRLCCDGMPADKQESKNSILPQPAEEKPAATATEVADEVEQVRNNGKWMEMMVERFQLTEPEIDQRLREFVLDCRCRGIQHHKDLRDTQCHIHNWLMAKQRINDNNQQSNNTTHHDTHKHRPTSADFIAEAQRKAYERTEDLIRRARERRERLQRGLLG